MTEDELRDEIARKKALIDALSGEIDDHRRTLGETPGVSPFAPKAFPALPVVAGVRFAAVNAGVRYTTGRLDVMLAVLEPGSVMAGTFTRSKTRAAPVLWCEDRISGPVEPDLDQPMAIVVNAGNANAFTGSNGMQTVEAVMHSTANALGTGVSNVFMASTGVIGEPLPSERIETKLWELREALSPDRIDDAAKAIMTTDTFPKGMSTTVELDGALVTISGIAKGSGMIAPDMATMLVFVFTDAAIDRDLLQQTVSELTDQSFNAITVDSDTSTSDTLLVGATGKADMTSIESSGDPRYPAFRNALLDVMRELAIQVVKDGEGASKFAAITVNGATDDGAARRIGLAIANSPLVKTALAGEDPNWGRIVMAVGKSGEAADRDKLLITFGDITVAEGGWVSPNYTEDAGAAYMKNAELEIGVDVGVGSGSATVWTCDLTHEYITINADYRS
ncbi:MAG: bifunctional glutamate N-acetyltransferase/amino-acid acetyltransferase ArgJ [Pseudomonadota bacterium]